MNIVDSGTGLHGKFMILHHLQNIEVGTCGFKGEYVGIQGGDIVNDASELAVTHVRMYLCIYAYGCMCQMKCFSGPIEIFSPIFLMKR